MLYRSLDSVPDGLRSETLSSTRSLMSHTFPVYRWFPFSERLAGEDDWGTTSIRASRVMSN